MTEVNNEKLHIRLHVYDEERDVTIPRVDEELYRKAEDLWAAGFSIYEILQDVFGVNIPNAWLQNKGSETQA